MASTEETNSAWEQTLENHPALSRLGQKESVHAAPFSHLSTASLHAGYASLQADVKKPFKNILTGAITGVEEAVDTFVDGIESFGRTGHDSDAWGQAINEATRKAEKSFQNILQKCFTDGKGAIGQMPPSERQSAAEAFSQSVEIVSQLMSQVQRELESVPQRVQEFRHQIWTSIEQIRNQVKQQCSQASLVLDN